MSERENPYNPLDKVNLGTSVANAILAKDAILLTRLSTFDGAGIYALYYKGLFMPYQRLTQLNLNQFVRPIYVGKAVPEGSRKGGLGAEVESAPNLYKRLSEHRKSIEQAVNLNIEDFFVRYLVVDDIWIPLGESLLIEKTKPLWNIAIDGFGNHAPGSGRHNQQISAWDTLHPGRPWAQKLPKGKTVEEILSLVDNFLK